MRSRPVLANCWYTQSVSAPSLTVMLHHYDPSKDADILSYTGHKWQTYTMASIFKNEVGHNNERNLKIQK